MLDRAPLEYLRTLWRGLDSGGLKVWGEGSTGTFPGPNTYQ